MGNSKAVSSPGWARRAIAGTAALIGTIAWSHSLAALLRPLGPEGAPLAAEAITIAAVLVALAGAAAWPRRTAALVAGSTGLGAAIVINLLYPGAFVSALAIAPVGAAVAVAGGWLARRIPAEVDGWPRRHRALAGLWLLVAVVAVVQLARLSTS